MTFFTPRRLTALFWGYPSCGLQESVAIGCCLNAYCAYIVAVIVTVRGVRVCGRRNFPIGNNRSLRKLALLRPPYRRLYETAIVLLHTRQTVNTTRTREFFGCFSCVCRVRVRGGGVHRSLSTAVKLAHLHTKIIRCQRSTLTDSPSVSDPKPCARSSVAGHTEDKPLSYDRLIPPLIMAVW